MKVFEFHFNPPKQSEIIAGQAKTIFDSFCYEPENVYEKKLGSLYIVGLLKNPLPQNLRFLDRLSQVIKEKYYTLSFGREPEKSLIESLKAANEFLAEEVKKENVSWLGNLSLAVLSLTSYQKPWEQFVLSFTKVGDLQIFLIRGNQIIDIGSQLEFQELEPYPLKIFFNIASGRLSENDLILVLTPEIADFFTRPALPAKEEPEQVDQNLFEKIANLSPFNEIKLREIFRESEPGLSKISGICLLIFLTKEIAPLKKEVVLPTVKELSLKEIFILSLKNLAKVFRVIVNPARLLFQKISQIFTRKEKPSKKKIKLSLLQLKIPSLPRFKIKKSKILNTLLSENFKKNLITILLLIFFLILGYFISQKEKEERLEQYQNQLNQFQEKLNRAENLLMIGKISPEIEQEINLLLRESWQGISTLIKKNTSLPTDLSRRSLELKDEIEKKLFQINKLEKIEESQPFFEFKNKEFTPQKVISFREDLYFFNPFSQNLFKVNRETRDLTTVSIAKKFNFGATLPDSIILFSRPDQLTILKNGEIFTHSLQEPYSDFSLDALAVFNKNLYFLDKKAGQIIKYPYLKDLQWGPPQVWLTSQTKKTAKFRSIAVDGSIWILNDDNSIDRYYAGHFQETIRLEIFPYPKKFSKILVARGIIFILEPSQNRLIIIDKSGKIIKQFQSDQFNNLLDFTLSDDGKMIWLLNGWQLYQIFLS